ncbi:leucine-rich repeat domain-containing protein [Wukongibacter baidiensis]|uniref:leucine-rich repeat domain-containing protein n=1 Tax=Wukongibacter baidiensis TaxID=1723361 RepID=UPI003D7FAEE5
MHKIESYLKGYFGDKFQYYMLNPHLVKRLEFEDMLMDDIERITMFSNLIYLNISGTEIQDIEPIKSLKNLQVLYADFCKITDLLPLSELYQLRELDFSAPLDCFDNIEPLSNLKNLKKLYIPDHLIKTIKPIYGLDKLKVLSIQRTKVPLVEVIEFKLLNDRCEVLY